MTLVFNRGRDQEKRRILRRVMTREEWKLWWYLRRRDMWPVRFCRQYGVGPFVVDFYAPHIRLAIEIDGGQHALPQAVAYDEQRTEYLEAYDMIVLRFTNLQVQKEMRSVLGAIHDAATKIPSLSRRGRGGRPAP
ncbi:MAG: endonuclease domain-containing protein [Patescibacteria group bacterium]